MTNRIVLIEDDPDITALVRDMLIEVGREVDVLDHLSAGVVHADVPLVITDLVGMRTFDAGAARGWIARVRAAFPNAKIVVSTAHTPAGSAGAVAIGADVVLVKPFEVSAFTDTVESLLGA